jgi:putative PIN family toxin of toxin-antitoxin system
LPTLRVVLDTNVLVSGMAYPASIPGRIVAAWRKGALELVLSRHIVDELARVLPRLNHRLNWAPGEFADFLDILSLQADLVDPEPLEEGAARDERDVPVLGTLIASRADYLITGDRDLLTLAGTHSNIVAPADFWKRHGG